MKIYVGQDFEVWKSGIVIGNPDDRIAFEINKENEFIIYFEFNKARSWMGNTPILRAESFGKNSLLLSFDNSSNTQGHGNLEPLEVGILNNRKFYLNYRIYSSQKGDFNSNFKQGGITLMYTWLLGDKVQ